MSKAELRNDVLSDHVRYSQAFQDAHMSPLSISTRGDDFTGLGCFQLGLEVSAASFMELLQAQRNLRELALLNRLSQEKLHTMGENLKIIQNTRSFHAMPSAVQTGIADLIEMLG